MTFLKNLYQKSRHIAIYGLLLALFVFLLKWLQWEFLIVDNSLDIYIGLIAACFTVMGIVLASRLSGTGVRTVIIEKEISVSTEKSTAINQAELRRLGLSSREYEVLQLMAKGYSNSEIAASLFLSLSTVKTHASNLYVKMDVRSRTQAMEKAKRLNIIP